MAARVQIDQRVHAIRSFNRFYTRQLGLLGRGYLNTELSLTEVRVLYELTHRPSLTAAELVRELALDAGYISRILAGFKRRGWLKRTPSKHDGRQTHLTLTPRGQAAFAPLEDAANQEAAHLLGRLTEPDQTSLVQAMHTIETLVGASLAPRAPYILRPHRPGDMGWVIHRHGVLYAQEYGWDERFEALVAEIAAKFIQNFNAARERCWIAETEAGIIGSVFLVTGSADIAKLRLLLVEPGARGLGIGTRLVDECILFARQARYKKITLWTQNILLAARQVYRKAGFRVVKEEPQCQFGAEMISETWELDL